MFEGDLCITGPWVELVLSCVVKIHFTALIMVTLSKLI